MQIKISPFRRTLQKIPYTCNRIEATLPKTYQKEALCLFSYTEIQLVAYAVLKGGSCLIHHIGTYKNKHFNWFMINFSFLFQLE